MAQAASLTRSGESAVLALYRIHISCTENYPEEGRCSLIRDTGHSFSSLVPSLDLKKKKTLTCAFFGLGTRLGLARSVIWERDNIFLVTRPHRPL